MSLGLFPSTADSKVSLTCRNKSINALMEGDMHIQCIVGFLFCFLWKNGCITEELCKIKILAFSFCEMEPKQEKSLSLVPLKPSGTSEIKFYIFIHGPLMFLFFILKISKSNSASGLGDNFHFADRKYNIGWSRHHVCQKSFAQSDQITLLT